MSDTKKKLTYAEKHDFMTIGVSQLSSTVAHSLRADKPLVIIGPAGIGKTDIVHQVAYQHGMDCTPLHLSQLVPEDLTGIPVPDMDREIVKFLKLDLLPRDGRTVLFLDEIGQCDLPVQRPIFQLLTDRRIGSYRLPPGCRIIAASNPDGSNYQTTKPTPALRRRLIWVEVKFEVVNWLTWAQNNDVHELVIEYIRRNKDDALNLESLDNDKVFANPAGWVTVSDILKSLGPDDQVDEVLPLVAGTVGLMIARKFVKFVSENSGQVSPAEVLHSYQGVRNRVLKYAEQGRTDALASLASSVVYGCLEEHRNSTAELDDKMISNVGQFFVDLPNDTAVLFGRSMKEAFEEAGDIKGLNLWSDRFFEQQHVSKKMFELMHMKNQMERGEY